MEIWAGRTKEEGKEERLGRLLTMVLEDSGLRGGCGLRETAGERPGEGGTANERMS